MTEYTSTLRRIFHTKREERAVAHPQQREAEDKTSASPALKTAPKTRGIAFFSRTKSSTPAKASAGQEKQKGRADEGYLKLMHVALSLAARADREVQATIEVVHYLIAQSDAPYTGGSVMLLRRGSFPWSYRKGIEEGKHLFLPPHDASGPSPSPFWHYLLSNQDENEEEEEEKAEKALTMCETELKAIGESIHQTLVQVLHQTIGTSKSEAKTSAGEAAAEDPHRNGAVECTSLWEVPLPPPPRASSNGDPKEMEKGAERRRWEVHRVEALHTHDSLTHVERILEEERRAIAAARIEVVLCKEEVRARRRYKAIGGGPAGMARGWWKDAETLVYAARAMETKRKEEEEENAKRAKGSELVSTTPLGASRTLRGVAEDEERGTGKRTTARETKMPHGGSTIHDIPMNGAGVAPALRGTSTLSRSPPPPPTPHPGPKMHLSLMTGSKHLLESVVQSVSQSVKDADDVWARKVMGAIGWDTTKKGKGEREDEMEDDDEEEEEEEEIKKNGERRGSAAVDGGGAGRRVRWKRVEEDVERKGNAWKVGNDENRRRKKKTMRAVPYHTSLAQEGDEEAARKNDFFSTFSPTEYTAEETASLTLAHAQLVERQHDIVAEEVVQVEAAVQDLSHLNSLVSEAVWTQREKFSLVMKNTEEAHQNLKKATAELEKPLKKFWNARRQVIALLWWCILTMWFTNWLFR